jgi:hypothetical protein
VSQKSSSALIHLTSDPRFDSRSLNVNHASPNLDTCITATPRTQDPNHSCKPRLPSYPRDCRIHRPQRPAHHQHVKPVRSAPSHSPGTILTEYRFGRSDARDDLFSTYNRSASPSKSKSKTQARASPYNASYGYPSPDANSGFGAYPGAGGASSGGLYPGGYGVGGGYNGGREGSRSSTPGNFSAATLDELESQNDNEHVGMLTSKVKQLKDVSLNSLLPYVWK